MKRQITSGTTIHLEPVDDAEHITEPVFAINWFNTKRAWLYNFYNFLAAPSVIRVGARVLIKARVTETLLGDDADYRNMLLVVNYRSGEGFLDLLSIRFFQAISIFRRLSVQDFSFIFHRRVDGPGRIKAGAASCKGGKACAIHHFRSSGPLEDDLSRINALTSDQPVTVFFASEKTACVVAENKAGERQAMPFETHKLVIFEAETATGIEAFLCGREYRAFADDLDFSYAAALHRIM